MIRIDEGDAWLLLGHSDHAALAGEFARHWKNQRFSVPAPFVHVLDAVSRHDDSWKVVDAQPNLTPEGNPSAFSHELVGSYDAFEEIDLEDYLGVRGQATEQAAARDPYSAILISMHTVNLLTEQADLSKLSDEEAQFHRNFVEGQEKRQEELMEVLRKDGFSEDLLSPTTLRWGFEFLQACDSLSLLVGVDYPENSELRHAQRTRMGERVMISFTPKGEGVFALDPYPLDEENLEFEIPYSRILKSQFSDLESFREAYSKAEKVRKPIRFISKVL